MNYTKPAKIAAVVACLCLVAAVLLGLGNAAVWTLATLAITAVGGVVYLTRHTRN